MKILIVIPAHNEKDSLPDFLTEIKTLGFDSIVINDASTDNTAEVARSCGSAVISLPANLGIGGAVQTGFKYALRSGYDVVVQMDGDGQHDPAWLKQVLQPILTGTADCVIGSRYMRNQRDESYKTSLPRRLGMHFSSGILFLATGLHITDTTSGFRALTRPAFDYFSRAYPTDHPEAEALLMLHRVGFRIQEVPIKMRGRTSGESLFTFTKSLLYPFRVVIGFMGLLLQKRNQIK
jgi:glycosyltransferase involved in cell wall biosynthesis